MLKERLKEYTCLINEELDRLIKTQNCPEKELLESMKYSLTAGGKRLRPALVLEGYRLFKDDYEKAVPFACAMEMVHTFSLPIIPCFTAFSTKGCTVRAGMIKSSV